MCIGLFIISFTDNFVKIVNMVQYSDDVDDEKKIDYCVNQNKQTGLRIINISAIKY